MIEIIIVKYHNRKYEDQCIKAVLDTVDIPYHLTIYENYENDDNLSTVWNRLIDRSNADYICLLNNDTLPKGKWLERLLDVAKQGHIAGAITNQCGTHQSGFEGERDDGVIECNTLSGFCMVFSKKIWKQLNGFDERYKLYGEDSDFVRRARYQGIKLMTVYNAFVYHYGGKSNDIAVKKGKDIDNIKKESSQLYAQGS